jgi:small-conductance mechanosensitive channel
LLLIILRSLSDNFIDTTLLERIELFQLFDAPTTLGILLRALLILYFAIIVSQLIQDLLKRWLTRQANFEPAISESILNATRYLVIGVGILFAASIFGFSFASLAIIGGGLSVGIGLGLQKIAANFVSGILLWTDRTIRLGDTIEVGTERGTVEKMSIRSTIVKTLDNVELIIPNENLMTSIVRTYTKTERTVRLNIDIGVAYGSDPQEVRKLILDVVGRHNLVRKNPVPTVLFTNFGDSSLDFRINVWVEDPRYLPQVPSDLRFMLFEAFKQHKIEIPFPQRDLNLGDGWEKLIPNESIKDVEQS